MCATADGRACAAILKCQVSTQSYPRKLAYEYLEELANEFGRLYGSQVDAVARPYAFIKFGGLLQTQFDEGTPCACAIV